MLQILDKKMDFKGSLETLKSGMHTPVYKNGKYPLPSLGVTSRINSWLNSHNLKTFDFRTVTCMTQVGIT